MNKNRNIVKSLKIRSIQANSLYIVNNYQESEENSEQEQKKPYLDIGITVINDSLFTEYMKHHGVVSKQKGRYKGRSRDFIVMKFDYGVKDGMSAQELRDFYYKNGATVVWPIYDKNGNVTKEDPVHYKMLMRSAGKSKQGDCIFIRENLYQTALRYITMDLWDKMPYEHAKIVEMSAYAPLTTATAIDYITIPMENIFIVKDEDAFAVVNAVSVKTRDVPYIKSEIDWDATEDYINENYGLTFYIKKSKKNSNLTYIKKTKDSLISNGIRVEDCPQKKEMHKRKRCYVDRPEGKSEVKNVLWDGMGLIDENMFPDNMDGFIYCRSHFFKSCLFRGNIQEYFKDYYGDSYENATATDMFGNVFLVKDIKVIITENSIKWMKFKNLMGKTDADAYSYYKKYMKKHGERFAIVKTGHASKYGDLQRSSYQINNSLPCVDRVILERIAKASVDYCNSLKLRHEAFIKHLVINASKRYSINNVLIALDEWNENFRYTEYFKKKRNDIISKFKNERLKLGKLLQYGDNLTICGNPVALLMKVTGQDFLNEPCFKRIDNGIQCYTTRFKDGERLAGFRSPHNSPNNIVHLVNTYSEEIQKYFPNMGNNVIVINGIGTDVQSRLNGQDLDTDSVYVTNQTDIVQLAEEAYMNYPTIINDIPLTGDSEYRKDMESYAKMDNKISSAQYAIGNASNIAQLALSYYYDSGCKSRELEDVFIICSVLAQVAIDGCKREFDISVNSELQRISSLSCMQPEGDKKYPVFYAERQRQKGYNIEDSEIRKFNCPMEILADIIEENVIDMRKYRELVPHTCNFSMVFRYQTDRSRDSKQYKKVISIVQEYDREVNKLDKEKENYSGKRMILFDECVGKMKNLKINKSTMSSLIAYAFADNGDIRDRLLTVLYDKDSKMFLSCFTKRSKNSAKNTESLDFTKVS